MKLSVVVFALVAMCAVSYAQYLQQPMPLQPRYQNQVEGNQMVVVPQQNRQKRSLLLGGLGAAALGAGIIGAGAIGAGAIGAGAIGVGLLGAKAGFIGGAIASKAFHGRSYGGYGGGYEHYGGGYGGGYAYASPVYAAPIVYRSYQPSYYVEDEWC